MKVLYDGDPGIDDAMAIILATRLEKIELIGVTTVSGNCSATQATKNALNILTRVAGEPGIPVAMGAEKPLLRESKPSVQIHGFDGLGETSIEDPELKPLKIHAVDMILSNCRDLGDELVIVTGGPLTNLALACLKEPQLFKHIHKIIVMGGCIRSPGNITSAAEFNIYHDPEAAKIIFKSELPITLVSLDITVNNGNCITSEDLKTLKNTKKDSHKIIFKMLHYYINSYKAVRGVDGCYMHDSLAMILAAKPNLITKKEQIYIDVEISGEITLGRTQADLRCPPSQPPNIIHCREVDYVKTQRIFRTLVGI